MPSIICNDRDNDNKEFILLLTGEEQLKLTDFIAKLYAKNNSEAEDDFKHVYLAPSLIPLIIHPQRANMVELISKVNKK